MKVKTYTPKIGDITQYVLLIIMMTILGYVILAGLLEVNDTIEEWIISWITR